MKLYGLKTCDACRKAIRALKESGRAVDFVDLRADGASRKQIEAWAKAAGWRKLLNRSSTTWRGLDAADKENLDEKKALALMAANPTLIKRPVIEMDGKVFIGWSDATREALL
ncbi:Spx/MgsR family RNA polymerase-binding regulatory protein [Amphiplicatus metriothermophilus]|uniref:Arsenate reductase n=1 Tax=Amphiplicatus metriothermophilus TaxID=1519374 RepID=A0A239PL84_9PROT|nr:Spx/MgsR family RNA polymerase-binding regulatory protein [Amphiplicatus metriothermophilus]MBB5517287.1 arsenate reductase [Amphiplicatus metriothermophilus]SNT68377.1 arsenate reductase [Amphiplicatus metriothermophilus]